MRVCKLSTARNVCVLMIDSTDHITGKASLTLTITASKNGAAFASISPTVTDLGSGWYNLALTSAHTDTAGDLALHITGTGCDPQDVLMQVVAYDPTDAAGLGLSRVDAAISSRLASASYTAPDNTTITNIYSAVDTEVAAIKAKTDQLTFTTANKVDSTIQAAGDFAQGAADKVWSTATRALTDKAGFALSAAGIQAIWDALTAALTTVGSIGKLLVDNINATISSRSTYAGGAVASVTGSVGSVAAGGITAASFGASAIDAAALATDAGQEIADRILTRSIAGGSDAGRTVKQAFAATRNKVEIVAGTLTVYDTDDTTVLYTAAVTTTAGNPVSAIDPA